MSKTLCSSNREERLSTVHMISPYFSANKLMRCQLKMGSKNNAIIAISEFLGMLD